MNTVRGILYIYWIPISSINSGAANDMKIVITILFVIVAFCAPSSGAAPVCVFGTVPCFLFCGGPPQLMNAAQAANRLQQAKYDKLSRFDEVSAVVTTQFGKCLGINGWKRYHFRVSAVGTVDQAATSWDGLRTVDILLDNFNDHSLPAWPLYIRAEIIRHVWEHLDHPPCAGDHVRVEGELHWDGHGFLEIHPSLNGDVDYLPASSGPTIWSPVTTPAGI
jgi:hypothetical protein